MGAVIGLLFGVGLLLFLTGFTTPPRRERRPRRHLVSARDAAHSLLAVLLVATATLVLTAIPMAAIIAGLAAGAVPALVRRHRSQRLSRARAAAWPDAVDGLLTAVRAGVPLPEAITEAAVSGPEPLQPGFRVYASCWRRGGTFRQSLQTMQRYFADPAADRVIVSLALAAESGSSNVGRVLATQGEFLRSDLRMRAEIDAKQSWTVSAARVAVAAPWLAVAAVSVRTESAQAYATAAGAVVLLLAAAICAVAYWAMTRIAALPQATRLPEVQP